MSADPDATVVSVRVTRAMREEIAEKATALRMSTSDLIRTALQRMVSVPIGYRCEHVNITSAAGAIQAAEVSCCVMRPVYHPSEVELADVR